MFQSERKPNRSDYGIQQELLQMLLKLNERKSAQLFRQPVSPNDAPDYNIKILHPMDLSTIQNRLKEGHYNYASQVYEDLNLIINNCRSYNRFNENIMKITDKFATCINTDWQNFKSSLYKKGIELNTPLTMSQQISEKLYAMEQRKKKKRIPNAFALLASQRRSVQNQYQFYASLSATKVTPEQVKNENHFEGFEIKVDDFGTMTEQQRKKRLLIVLNQEEISDSFKQMSKKKLDKYRGILDKKINWFRQKILRKTMTSKKFKNLLVPAHLDKNIENQDIAKSLNIRKLQLFVKQIAYFVQAFQHILTDNMKQKFLTNCRAIRSCLAQIIKYKRIAPKSTKIKLQNPFIQVKVQAPPTMNATDPNIAAIDKDDTRSTMSEQTKGYQQKMKQFRRLLDKDKKDHTRKDTKVRLNRQQSGNITSSIVYQDIDRKKTSFNKKFSKDSYRFDIPKQDEQRKRQQELNQQKNRDRIFIGEYTKRSNIEIIRKYTKTKTYIDWQKGVQSKQHKIAPIEFFISK